MSLHGNVLADGFIFYETPHALFVQEFVIPYILLYSLSMVQMSLKKCVMNKESHII
jgi:hypothetical protein